MGYSLWGRKGSDVNEQLHFNYNNGTVGNRYISEQRRVYSKKQKSPYLKYKVIIYSDHAYFFFIYWLSSCDHECTIQAQTVCPPLFFFVGYLLMDGLGNNRAFICLSWDFYHSQACYWPTHLSAIYYLEILDPWIRVGLQRAMKVWIGEEKIIWYFPIPLFYMISFLKVIYRLYTSAIN